MRGGISVFTTPDEATGTAKAFYAWMETGFAMFAGAAGFPTLETFPHAVAVALRGSRPERRTPEAPGREATWRRAALEESGIDSSHLRSIDEIDAALCAVDRPVATLRAGPRRWATRPTESLTVPLGLPSDQASGYSVMARISAWSPVYSRVRVIGSRSSHLPGVARDLDHALHERRVHVELAAGDLHPLGVRRGDRDVGIGDRAEVRREEPAVLELPRVLDVAVGTAGDHVLDPAAGPGTRRLVGGHAPGLVEPLLREVAHGG